MEENKQKEISTISKIMEDDNVRFLITALVKKIKDMKIPISSVLQAIEKNFYSYEEPKIDFNYFKNKVEIFRAKHEDDLKEIKISSVPGKPEEFYIENFCRMFEVFYKINESKTTRPSIESIKKYGSRFNVDKPMLEESAIVELFKGMNAFLKKILESDNEFFYDRLEIEEKYRDRFRSGNYRKNRMIMVAIIWAIINEK